MKDKKLNEAYYQPNHLWTGWKAIREVHKTLSIPQRVVKPCLAKHTLWQVYIPTPRKINHPLQFDKT